MSRYSLEYLRDHSRVDVSRSIPWTARALGISTVEAATADMTSDGTPWLFDGPVPMANVRDLLDSFAIASHPLAFLRPAMPWDDPAAMVTFDGQSYTVVTDASRQVITDAKRDTVHFVPREGYTPRQFTESLIDRTSRIVGHGIQVSSVVVLAHGAEAVIGVSTASLETTPEGVTFYPVLLAADSCNGTLSTTTCLAFTDPVCDNTRDMALAEGKANGTMFKAKHTRNSAAKLAEQEDMAAEALGILDRGTTEYAAMIAEWCAVDVTAEQDTAWLQHLSGHAALGTEPSKNAVTRADNAADKLLALRRDNRVSPWNGTGWGALQLASTFDQWDGRSTRGGTDPFARIIRETVTGATAAREAERVEALRKILATV